MSEPHRKSFRLTVLALVALSAAACSSVNETATKAASVVRPYKIDLVQGNVVTREQLAALRPGMPRSVTRDVLGTSLLTSVFHADRWDYVFTFKRQGAESQSRRVTVFFKNDVIDRIEADDLPSEAEFVSTLQSGEKLKPVPPLEASEESLSKFPVAPKPAPANPAPQDSAPVTYPPLEPARQ